MNGKRRYSLLVCIIGVALFLIPRICGAQVETLNNENKENVIYLELIEENVDTFESILFMISRRPGLYPFWLKKDTLFIDEEALGLTEEEAEAQGYILKLKVDVNETDKQKVYLQYIVRFNGQGRNHDWSEYYLFNQFPQIISLPSYEGSSPFYTLKESIINVLKIRLNEGDLKILDVSSDDSVSIEYKGEIFKVPGGQEIKLGKKTQTIQVIDGSPSSTKLDYGDIQFTTELKLINYGMPSKIKHRSRRGVLDNG